MTPRDASAAVVRRLLAEVQADRRALAERDAELDRFLGGHSPMDDVHAAATALVLERTYTGLEAMLERVIRVLDGDSPRGLDWHRGLLATAALDVPTIRPAVLTSTLALADELRRFRHFIRHAYAAPVDPARMGELALAWQAARPLLAADLDRFEQFLADLADRMLP